MDRIKTRLIIAVTNRLSAAADTNAKTELIEELSDNLYQRYLDLTAAGVDEGTAYAKALEDLGDVDELLEYLRSLGPDEELPRQNGGHINFNANIDDIIRGAEDIVRETIHQTKDAVDQAKVIVRDVAHKLKERYPHGFSYEFHFDRGPVMEGTSFPAAGLKGLDIHLVNGDVNIRVNPDPNADVILSGDTQQLDIRLSEDGILSIRPDKTAAASFFSMRGLVSSDVYLALPPLHWETISITTVNGDVDVYEELQVDGLTIRTASGDVDLHGVTGDVRIDSASGDVDLYGTYSTVSINTASGDVDLDGNAHTIRCASASGDADLRLISLPNHLDASTKSGDCEVHIPSDLGFTLRFSTVSGDLDTNFALVGPIAARSGEAVYLDGGASTLRLTSVSGDLTLRHL